jgi:hypothetical protein
MDPHTALLLLYFAGMGPAPYSEFAIPHMYGHHVRLRPFVLKVRNMAAASTQHDRAGKLRALPLRH